MITFVAMIMELSLNVRGEWMEVERPFLQGGKTASYILVPFLKG